MHCNISVENNVFLPLSEELINRACQAVLDFEKIKRPAMVSVSFVSTSHMQELNKRYRGQDKPTDVISLECERPDDPALAPLEPCELGDIVLAPELVALQAEQFGWSTEEECLLLLVHGMLHLLGYDHLNDGEAEIMETKEDTILADLCSTTAHAHVQLTRHRDEII